MNEYITYALIENTYLFCVRRISDSEAARDLSQDILYEALRVIASGKEFVSFYSWYWKMARNKYADYIASKQNSALPIETAGGMAAEMPQPIESVIAAEDISQLNFSLSRLASIHREIIIRFYLKEQTVRQIANELSIPEGTVKRRLFDAKKNLKERFQNMNNIGKTAYAPADVSWFWGYEAVGPSMLMASSKIYPQIMVICRNEAKKLNEIADEMGVAPIYLEEAINKMLNTNLLVSHAKDKYQANWCVFPREVFMKAELYACDIFHDNSFGERITEKLLGLKEKITSLDFYGNHFDYSYLMWLLYVQAGYVMGHFGGNYYRSKYGDKYPKEADIKYGLTMHYVLPDENYDYSALDKLREIEWSCLEQGFNTAKHGKAIYQNNFDMTPFPINSADDSGDWRKGRDRWVNSENISLLIELAHDPDKTLSSYEEEKAAEFLKNGLLKKEQNKLIVQLPVMK
ncbi:MAG: sigma-70 family RNA polymerase sigma factor, partial [Oscillospiraceae bacterium]|nr:sigma-70 family RNA polymerase sigma factor [Oscillospiraceae bacterium]